jgi:hypothetical protein
MAIYASSNREVLPVKYKSSFIFVAFLVTSISGWAKNPCSCYPIPESKNYQGEARKKHLIGYSIDWSCNYTCAVNEAPQEGGPAPVVMAFYHEYYVRSEIGTEGICEGMVYKARFNQMMNQYIYMYEGENFGFKPSNSTSENLRKWAEANSCD